MIKFQNITLDDRENTLFEEEWLSFWEYHFRHNREIWDSFKSAKEEIKFGARVAKYELERCFGGYYARKNEFGWVPLLSDHFGIPRNREIPLFDINTQWIDWIGSAICPFTTLKNTTIIMLGITTTDTPKVDAVTITLDGEDLPITYLSTFERAHQISTKLPMSIILPVGRTLHMKTHVFDSGLDATQPFGVLFATGEYLRKLSKEVICP